LALASTVARALADVVEETIEMQGSATLAVPAGATARLVWEELRELPLAWSQVTVTLTDECWVPLEHVASKERQLRESLLVGSAAAARLVGLKTTADSPELARSEVDDRLAALVPFDLVVVEMGDAGDMASLLPDAPEIEDALDLESSASCLAIRSPSAPPPRLSLTLAALLFSRHRCLLFSGDAQHRVYRRAMQEGPVEELPVRGLLHPHSRALYVYWAP
jgi:6-phosphogluconolactonase